MSSKLLKYSSRKVCVKYYDQNQRFRLFSTVDQTTCKASRLLCWTGFCSGRLGLKRLVRVRVSND